MPRLQMLSWGKGVRCLNLHGELQHNTSATKATPSRSHHTNWWWLQPILGFTEKRRSRSHEAIYGEEPVRPGDHARRLWNYWDLELRQVEMVGHDWHMRMMNRKAIRSISLPGFAANSSSPLGYWPTGDFNRSSPLHSCRFPPATGFSKRKLEMTRSNIWWCHLQV